MKKTLSLIASLSLAFNVAASTLSSSYDEQRLEQYKEFYQEYNNKDYKIIQYGTRTVYHGNDSKEEPITEIIYGNNIKDNLRFPFYRFADYYLSNINKEALNYKGPDANWYLRNPYDPDDKIVPIQDIPKEKIPQVMKDIMSLPEDMQKYVKGVIQYRIDGDSWLMIDDNLTNEEITKLYEKLKEIDKIRDTKQKPVEEVKPVIPTKNQLLPISLGFPHAFFTDENNNGILDHIALKYCLDGNWFDENAKVKRFHLLQWYELNEEGEKAGLWKYDKPCRITIDFDYDKEYEEKGFDIEFYDKDHDGVFEDYKLIKK